MTHHYNSEKKMTKLFEKISSRLEENKVRYWANDNISD